MSNAKPTLTERVIGAFVVRRLLSDGLLTRSKAEQACRTLGISRVDLDVAKRRPDRPLTDSPLCLWVPDMQDEPAHRAPKNRGAAARQHANMRPGPNGRERRCARCGGWFPATSEWFGWKSKAKGTLRSYCQACWSARQANTYLSEARRQVLEGLVTFTVPAGADVAGVRCAKCGRPIRPGDEVHGSTDLTHTSCGAFT